MVDCRRYWSDVVSSVLAQMGVMVANGPIVASTVFGIDLGCLVCQ